MLLAALGGIGLFLLGITLLTDGLKALAGDALRVVLTRAVSNPWAGAAWGTILTVIVQSSSATSLVTIGLVSAGLLSFAESVGVIVGANIGKTATGWLVAMVGVNVSIAKAAAPFVALGATMRMLGKGRWSSLGVAIAGFGLLFMGIDALTQGMSGLNDRIEPSDLPLAGPLVGRLILVLLGAAITVVLQSSSVVTAMTLAALHAGAISFDQAAALVVGQNIGTCATALMTMPGSSPAAKRTAMSHFLFNLVTGVVVFAFLPASTAAVWWFARLVGMESPTTTLALYHTSFNLLGAAMILPSIKPFTRMVERLIPERGLGLTSGLDQSVTEVAEVALEAARRVVARTAAESIRLAMGAPDPGDRRATEVQQALGATRGFLTKLGSSAGFEHQQRRLVSLLHALDHAENLFGATREQANASRGLRLLEEDPEVPPVRQTLHAVADWLDAPVGPSVRERAGAVSASVANWRRRRRVETIESGAASADAPATLDRLDAIWWLDRVMYHSWRLCEHLWEPGQEADASSAAEPGAKRPDVAAPGPPAGSAPDDDDGA